MSRRLGPQDTAAGGPLKVPPSDSQSVCEGPQRVPSHHLWNMVMGGFWRLVSTPTAKMSRWLGPQDTAAGGPLKTMGCPPSDSHSNCEGPQWVPSHHLWNIVIVWSVAHSFAPTCSSFRRRKNSSRPVPISPRQQRRRAQISIALLPHRPRAAPLSHYFPTRFRALAVFSRRLPERVARSSLPAAENLHICGPMHCSNSLSLYHLVDTHQ